MGSSAAKRLPTLHTCHPTHSAFQWSTAAKVQTQPSSTVKTRTPSVPHMTWGAKVMMVPSWSFGSPWRPRCGDSSPCVRITRSTCVWATRIPSKSRSRAWTLRWPSPWKGDRARSARIAASNCSSESRGLGPRRAGTSPCRRRSA